MPARGVLARICGESTGDTDEVQSIVANLQVLLNTRLGDALTAPGFGVIDLVDVLHNFPFAAQIMQRSIRATIVEYEPRLDNVHVRLVESDDPMLLTFEISARLASDNRRGPIRLRGEMTPHGRVSLG